MSVYGRSLRASLPAAIIAIAVYLCFLDKPFNIDDPLFLTMAEHMLEDPLHPASIRISLNGHPPSWVSNGMWSGPVMPALLVPCVAAGGAEWVGHLAMLAVFLLGIVATAAFAVRLGVSDRGARWASLLVTTSAGVLAMASTAMPDVPCMSFGILGAERLLAYRKEGGWWRAASAAVALALCVLSRQHGVLLVACLAPIMFERWPHAVREWRAAIFDRRFLAAIGVMAAAGALVVATYAMMRDGQAPGSLASTAGRVADGTLWRVNLANIPAQWLLTFPLALAWACMYRLELVKRWWCYVGAGIGVYLAIQTHVFTRRPDWLPWQAPLTAFGAAMLADVVASTIRRRDMVELGLVAWLFIMFPMAVYTHLPAKYFVPSAPAMAVLIMRRIEAGALVSRAPLAILCAIGGVLGVLIIHADATHAEVGRAGGAIAAKYAARGERVWFDGAWAFHWYADRAGAIPATTSDEQEPGPGDIVVVGLEGHVIKKWPNKTLLERHEFKEPGGRTLQRPAGFFSNVHWGPLPWVWSKRPHDPVEVYRIEPTN